MTNWIEPGPVMPVIVLEDAGLAVDLAHALVDAGIFHLEVTLRTASALDVITRIRTAVPKALVGAGTVLGADQWRRACDAGATFGVSPGFTAELGEAIRKQAIPFIPGVSTASEAMRAMNEGFHLLKLFPAEAVGGRALLRALHGPLPQLRFCPTGGIGLHNAADYLALPNVQCVGGSWLVPQHALDTRDWAGIGALAREAVALRRA